MSETEFNNHKVALSSRLLESVKNLGEESHRYWSHIHYGDLDFEQHIQDAKLVQSISKETVLKLYRYWIKPGSSHQRKLSIHMNSQMNGKIGNYTSIGGLNSSLAGLSNSSSPVISTTTTPTSTVTSAAASTTVTGVSGSGMVTSSSPLSSISISSSSSIEQELLERNKIVKDLVEFKKSLEMGAMVKPVKSYEQIQTEI